MSSDTKAALLERAPWLIGPNAVQMAMTAEEFSRGAPASDMACISSVTLLFSYRP